MERAIVVIHWRAPNYFIRVYVFWVADFTATDPELQAILNQGFFPWMLCGILSKVAHPQG